MASEEQKKDLQLKILVVVVVLAIGGTVYAGSTPGLEKFKAKALAARTEEWAPRWIYNIGVVYENTWRRDKAIETYKDFYLNFSGDERKMAEGIAISVEESKYYPEQFGLIPKWNSPGRMEAMSWVGGQDAPPHELMGDVLMRLSALCEEDRNYPEARFYYMLLLNCWPSGTPLAQRANDARLRDLQRPF